MSTHISHLQAERELELRARLEKAEAILAQMRTALNRARTHVSSFSCAIEITETLNAYASYKKEQP